MNRPTSDDTTDLEEAWRRRMARVRTLRERLDYTGIRRRPRDPRKRSLLNENRQANPLV